ncbi:MAG: hypothetical protein H7A46_13715 [Verrucomicrobiales bacterium]|nr:hypothetical protein [Verrucomicrobiales bacterium]
MKKQLVKSAVRLLTPLLVFSATALGQTLYQDNFDTDTSASWTVNDPGETDITVVFSYDYSAIGVPAAPGGSGTTGLKMTANNTGGVFSGFSVSPTGESFSGNYRVSFDLWQNYVGPVGPGGSGTTQFSMFGIGTSGTTPIKIGNTTESLGFGATLDGGSSVDYRVYSSLFLTGYAEGDPVFQSGGGRNGSDPYYAVFGGESAPVDQVSLFPGQTGVTDAGELAFAWRSVTIEVLDGSATWSVDGTPIAVVDVSTVNLGGGNIFFGHDDTNAGVSTDPNKELLNVTLIDNVKVEALAIPEPGTYALGIIGALLLFGRRRK